MLVHAVLAALPPTVRELRLEAECCGPLCSILQHATQLASLGIGGAGGNGAFVQWDGRGSAAVVPKLTSLRLVFQEKPYWDFGIKMPAGCVPVPAALPPAMAVATQLSSLQLCALWDDNEARLLAALASLEELRWAYTLHADADDQQHSAARVQPRHSSVRCRHPSHRDAQLNLAKCNRAGLRCMPARLRTRRRRCLRWLACRACASAR